LSKHYERTSAFFGLEDVHHKLWLLAAGTLTNEEMQPSQKAIDRRNLIFFFEYTKMFFEAVQLLHNKHKKKNNHILNYRRRQKNCKFEK
jgi:hypothetical protein